jgi:type 1 fimbria pilin
LQLKDKHNIFKMKKKLIFSILASFLLSGCLMKPGIRGNGNVTKQQHSVSAFDKIEIASGPFSVNLTQGDFESVEVEIDDNLQQFIEVRNDGNKLVLDVKDRVKFGKTTKNNINITMKNIDLLSVSGVSKVKSLTTWSSDHITLHVSGVSDGELEVACDKLDATVSGGGSVVLRGKATEVNIKQTGVGSFNAKGLIAEKVSVVNSGVGSVSVYASQELSMSNSGVGSITYSGDADIKSIHSSGVGKISKSE